MKTRIRTVLVLVIALCGFIASNGYSADDKYSRESLKGIKGVRVIVENLSSEAISDGLTSEIIMNDVELRLRQNGIKVMTEEEEYKTPGTPWLYIQTNLVKLISLNAYSFSVTINLNQDVKLDRNKYSISAVTWNISMTGYVSVKTLNSVRGDIKDLVDRFINAYLSVNPKK